MLGFPTQLQYTLPFFSLMLLCIIMTFLGSTNPNHFVFDLQAINQGEFWRVLTGQFVHSNLNHAYLNCAGLLLVWALHGEYYPKFRLFYIVGIAASSIGLCLWYFGFYNLYFGLSGIIHFLLVFGAFKDLSRKEKTGYLLIAGMIIKVSWEMMFGTDDGTSLMIEAAIAFEAHAIGVTLGFVAGTVCLLREKVKVPIQS